VRVLRSPCHDHKTLRERRQSTSAEDIRRSIRVMPDSCVGAQHFLALDAPALAVRRCQGCQIAPLPQRAAMVHLCNKLPPTTNAIFARHQTAFWLGWDWFPKCSCGRKELVTPLRDEMPSVHLLEFVIDISSRKGTPEMQNAAHPKSWSVKVQNHVSEACSLRAALHNVL
jgi:hypothetical protein